MAGLIFSRGPTNPNERERAAGSVTHGRFHDCSSNCVRRGLALGGNQLFLRKTFKAVAWHAIQGRDTGGEDGYL